MYQLPLEARNKLVKMLSEQMYWQTFQGRWDTLKRAGLLRIAPRINLEGDPHIVASRVVEKVQESGENVTKQFIQTLADIEKEQG